MNVPEARCGRHLPTRCRTFEGVSIAAFACYIQGNMRPGDRA